MNNTPLTDEQIQKVAPSAFAGQPYEKMSDKYAFVPTSEIISGMRNAGFVPMMAAQSLSRVPGKQNFTKHMLRFRSTNTNLVNVGDSAVETVLTNSHDGTSRYVLDLGLYRLACTNGMVVSDGLVESVRIRHVGNIVDTVISASMSMIEKAPVIGETIARWRSITLTYEEQLILAESVHALRFEEGSNLASAITPKDLLATRRYADQGDDLWRVFNRLQENAVRGGIRTRIAATGQRTRTRAVTGISENVKLNKALWTLAERMADLKK